MRLGDKVATMARRGAPLPYLRRVAYLESHGTEWINTGITPKIGCSIECEYSYNVLPVSFDNYQCLFSAGNGIFQLIALGADQVDVCGFFFKYFASGNAATITYYPELNTKYSLSLDSVGTARVGGYSSTSSPQHELDGGATNLQILRRANGTSYLFGRLYGFKMTDENGNEVLNMIPVLDLSGRPCMYNQAPSEVPADDSSRFFYNQGTGEFTWGELEAASNAPSQLGGGV